MYDIQSEEKIIVENVRQNLRQLMEAHGLKISNFCKYIENNKEISWDRSTFTKFMSNSVQSVNLAFLVSCSRVFNTSIDRLISPNFNPYENYQEIEEKYKDIIDKKFVSTLPYNENLPKEVFVENPKSSLLVPYMQSYFCYYHSTVAEENKTDNLRESLISGILTFEENGDECKATLKIDTKMCNSDGKPSYKIYSGKVILCPSIQSIHCILTLPKGEFCFLIFRYAHLNAKKQECRLAEVLSTSSKPEKRYPVVHRMLLSNEKLYDEDLEMIAPHLWMNSSDILISQSGLKKLSEESDDYTQIVQELYKNDLQLMYEINENEVKDIVKKYFRGEDISLFLTKLRSYSYAKRYNKVSTVADQEVRDVLRKNGHFQENNRMVTPEQEYKST